MRRAAIASNGRLQNVPRPILDCATSAILDLGAAYRSGDRSCRGANVRGFDERLVRVPRLRPLSVTTNYLAIWTLWPLLTEKRKLLDQ